MNYTPYHVHTQLSLLDSCTKYQEYVDRAKELGMTAFAFSEHGHVFEYYHKKLAIEEAGMKYIHAAEVYVTEDPDERIRDNYHCVLLARNIDGFYELNELISRSYNRANVIIVGDAGERYYYSPRITFEELINTSDNIIICTACIAGILSAGHTEIKNLFIQFLTENKHRCFLEVQHHNVESQIKYNMYLVRLSKQTGIRLIAGTDTHALNETHIKGRTILQRSKNIHYDDEDGWDLTFKSYDELVEAYAIQRALCEEDYLEAINNTNVMADMIEPFCLDTKTKYPHIYDNPIETFKKKINEAYKKHPYVRDRYSFEDIKKTMKEELDVYIKTGSIDFMLLQTYIREWEKENGIQCGYGRGSVSGSMIAYILGITHMDSKKFNLNFFRFMNPNRVSNADIDSDFCEADREKEKKFLLDEHMGLDQIQCSEIITFNTIALKGAIRDVCRGLYAQSNPEEYLRIADSICERVDLHEDEVRKEYPDVFEYVDILNGTVVSIGSHPSGVLVTDINMARQIGLCSISSSNYPVSMLNMKELDALFYVKLDVLGLDTTGIINDTCKMLGIDRVTPDSVDLEDEDVWKSIRDDTTMIFQWESDSAQAYIRKFMSDNTISIAKEHNPNFSYIKWFSFGNGLIRPGCASFRDDVAKGDIKITGFKELDEFLSATMGRITMQEDIMKFLELFCGYSGAESDNVRRGIAKKKGTEKFIDEIHDRFLKYSNEKYGVREDVLESIFPPIKQGILDATRYAFSWNHSDAYSCTGYIAGYLRYYYPVEFVTAALNTFVDKPDKTLTVTNYAKRNGIHIVPIKFRYSTSKYSCSAKEKEIYKGIESIKYMNAKIADELYDLRDVIYDSFVDLLVDIKKYTSVNSNQLDILIKLNFFSEFGDIKKLLKQVDLFNKLYGKKQIKKDKLQALAVPEFLASKHCIKETEKTYMFEDMTSLLIELCNSIKTEKTTTMDMIKYEAECLGYISTTFPNVDDNYYYVISVDGSYSKYITLHQLSSGNTISTKIKSGVFKKNVVEAGDVIKIKRMSEEKKWKKIGEEWVMTDNTEDILQEYSILKKSS